MPPVRIVVAEDAPVLRELFCEQLRVARECEVVGEASDGREAIATTGRVNPDILTLDLDMPRMGGLEVLQVVRWYRPNTHVIILSGHAEEATIMEALTLGARGYVVKGNGTKLEEAIRAVQRGEIWARRRVLACVLDQLVGLASRPFQQPGEEPAPI